MGSDFMQVFEFKSTVVCNEINLNGIAAHFGINKKFKWAEPLILNENNLQGILIHPEEKLIYIFHFGSIAFVNFKFHEMQDILKYLKNLDKDIGDTEPFKYTEDFKLEVREGFKPESNEDLNFEINYNFAVTGKLNSYYLDIIATVIAKSVALESVENGIETLLDKIEELIGFLDKGRLDLSDTQLAKMSGKILSYKYNTISYLMLLDKPDVAWKIEDAEELFIELSRLFELGDRYDNIKTKSETLMDITEVFSSLTHARKGTKLEMMVIILIAIEIVLFGIETISSLISKFF
jgi:Uncharacterized conserved protein